jgi:asparagine synthetase B (glutamine-hydrolysing)
MMPRGSHLRPVEIASGLVFGIDPEAEGRTAASSSLGALEAMERAVLPALLRPPCLVSFSGGRDSSVVLAVASRVARREGLELPVPATNRFPSVAAADEDEWQEHVVADLGLTEWARLEHSDELDCLGPVAAGVLRRHGLLWPFNAHFHVPLLRLASGGSLLTGIGGDEVLGESSWSETAELLKARRRPSARDVRRLAFATAPPVLRRQVLARRLSLPYGWLRPQARRVVAAAWARQNAAEPVRWVSHVRWVQRFRYLRVGAASLQLLAADDDVHLVHPFLDPGFADAVASLPRSARFIGRTALMQRMFGGAISEELLARSTKASFDAAFWSTASREFAAGWDGSGVDPELVDVDALRDEWATGTPDPRSFTLAQSAWLAACGSLGDRVQHLGDRVRQ